MYTDINNARRSQRMRMNMQRSDGEVLSRCFKPTTIPVAYSWQVMDLEEKHQFDSRDMSRFIAHFLIADRWMLTACVCIFTGFSIHVAHASYIGLIEREPRLITIIIFYSDDCYTKHSRLITFCIKKLGKTFEGFVYLALQFISYFFLYIKILTSYKSVVKLLQ